MAEIADHWVTKITNRAACGSCWFVVFWILSDISVCPALLILSIVFFFILCRPRDVRYDDRIFMKRHTVGGRTNR